MKIDTSKLTSGSWKTTLFGIITFVAGFIAMSPATFAKWPIVVELAKYIALGAGGAGLVAAKDSGVTGGTKLESGAVPDATLHEEAAAAPPKP